MICKMLEPASASIAFYLISKSPDITKNIIKKKPLYLRKKTCRWLKHNKHELMDAFIEEANDLIIDNINILYKVLYLKTINPSIFLVIYSIILIIAIIF